MNTPIDNNITKVIRDLYQKDSGARALFDWAANRKNDAAETNVERIIQVASISHQEANELAKNLRDAGCGEYIIGRKGWKTRVRWLFGLRSLGQAARGQGKLEEVDPELVEDVSDKPGNLVSSEKFTQPQLSISEAKERLAQTFGVSPDAIEITIRA